MLRFIGGVIYRAGGRAINGIVQSLGGFMSGTVEASFTVNDNGTAALENSEYRWRGGDGTNVIEQALQQDNATKTLQLQTLQNGAEIITKFALGSKGQLLSDSQELLFNIHDGEGAPTALIGMLKVTGDDFGGLKSVNHQLLPEKTGGVRAEFNSFGLNDPTEDAATNSFLVMSSGDGSGQNLIFETKMQGSFGSLDFIEFNAYKGAPGSPPTITPLSGVDGLGFKYTTSPGGAGTGVLAGGDGGGFEVQFGVGGADGGAGAGNSGIAHFIGAANFRVSNPSFRNMIEIDSINNELKLGNTTDNPKVLLDTSGDIRIGVVGGKVGLYGVAPVVRAPALTPATGLLPNVVIRQGEIEVALQNLGAIN
jgi:hypothetical protein